MRYNFASELSYKYDVSKVNTPPPVEVYREAMFNNINPIFSYRRLTPCLYSFKYIISQLHLPIMFGMAVYENFMNLSSQNDLLSEPQGEFLGLHAVLMIAYNDEDNTATIVNSHGEQFGDKGCFRMSYTYLMNKDLSFEHWCINSEQ